MPSLALFISYLHARKLASSTIKSYLPAISYAHKLKGLCDPTQAFLINKLYPFTNFAARVARAGRFTRSYSIISLSTYSILSVLTRLLRLL